MPVDFDKQAYWHDRFSTETSFEWLVSSAEFVSIIKPILIKLDPSSARILHIGSGTSDLQNYFRRLGFLDVTNVDYEPLAADRGRELEQQAFGDVKMKYAVADATQLQLSTGSGSGSGSGSGGDQDCKFHLVVDKSTVDAISCGGNDQVWRMASSVREHLAPGAVWISLSYSSSRFDIEGLPFDVEVLAKVPTPKIKATDPDIFHWCYLLRPK